MYKKNVTGNLHKIIATVIDMEVRMLNVSKRTAYMILAISIVVEVIGDAMLTASHGYDHALLGIALSSL